MNVKKVIIRGILLGILFWAWYNAVAQAVLTWKPVQADDFGAQGDNVTILLSALDLQDGRLQYSATLPEGSSLDPVTGLFTWAPSGDQVGIWTIRFVVSDGELSDYEDVQISVYSRFDANRDMSVNILDIIVVGQHFGETGGPGWILEDINRDGEINVLDLILIGQAEWRDYGVMP